RAGGRWERARRPPRRPARPRRNQLHSRLGRGSARGRRRRGRGRRTDAPHPDRGRLRRRPARRDDAAEEHLLLPQARLRPPLFASVTDWLAVCREAVKDVRGVLVELPTRDEREPVVGEGEGGDETTAIDAAAERVILERFQGIEGTTIVSEEVGIVGDGPTRIVVDPIDGSLNAKRGIPFFSVSIAVAEGETMDDVYFGYVYDFGSGEEWVAERGKGALLNGADLGSIYPKEEIEILSFEATLTSSVAEKAAA